MAQSIGSLSQSIGWPKESIKTLSQSIWTQFSLFQSIMNMLKLIGQFKVHILIILTISNHPARLQNICRLFSLSNKDIKMFQWVCDLVIIHLQKNNLVFFQNTDHSNTITRTFTFSLFRTLKQYKKNVMLWNIIRDGSLKISQPP